MASFLKALRARVPLKNSFRPDDCSANLIQYIICCIGLIYPSKRVITIPVRDLAGWPIHGSVYRKKKKSELSSWVVA